MEPQPVSRQHTTSSTHADTPFSAICAGLALLAAGTVAALGSAGTLNLQARAPAVALAAAAVVLGMGMVMAGMSGRDSGPVGALAVCALLSALLMSIISGATAPAAGPRPEWRPTSVAELQPGYSVAASDAVIDFRGLDSGAPLPNDMTVPISAVGSTVVVHVPSSIPITVNSGMAFSSIRFNDGDDSAGAWNSGTQRLNPAGSGGELILELRGGFSSISFVEP